MKMKSLYHILVIIFLSGGLSNSGYSQTSQDNQKPVTIFKSTERDSMQIWFYNRATVMGLKGEERDEFYNIILYHTFKMTHLEKKDKGYTPQQVRSKFEELLQKQHTEIKAILDEKQYSYYIDTYDRLLKGVYERKDWK